VIIRVNQLEDLNRVVAEILHLIEKGYRIFLLTGELGAGKTTLVQMFGKKSGVQEAISSPTFSLVNAYESVRLGIIYHMDLYRIEKETDLVQIGLEEYLESGQVCLIEWPAIAEDYFYPPFVRIQIEMETGNIRNFKITTHDTVDA
jgi:tRNA threonylcarbamoyladenosine biosynthesis protein TsaE